MSTDLQPITFPCHICRSPELQCFGSYEGLAQVTSDTKPWPAGGQLALCRSCGTLQKVADTAWRSRCKAIYANYELYTVSSGSEQKKFDSTGQARSRSSAAMRLLEEKVSLKDRGRLLDVGYGNGAFIRGFAAGRPHWDLFGSEIDDKCAAAVSRLPGVRAVYSCAIPEILGEFDLISFIHVLEHIAEPADVLGHVQKKLCSGGLVLIQVPAFDLNPFDLVVADHASHFAAEPLHNLISRCGFQVLHLEKHAAYREFIVIGKVRSQGVVPLEQLRIEEESAQVSRCLDWLHAVCHRAQTLIADKRRPFGVFGTAIAASWLRSAIGDKIDFYVDEDEDRKGSSHLGRPVCGPAEVPADSTVFIPLAPVAAEKIWQRLSPFVQWKGELPPPLGKS